MPSEPASGATLPGNDTEVVNPATYTLPFASVATEKPSSKPLPPRYVEKIALGRGGATVCATIEPVKKNNPAKAYHKRDGVRFIQPLYLFVLWNCRGDG